MRKLCYIIALNKFVYISHVD